MSTMFHEEELFKIITKSNITPSNKEERIITHSNITHGNNITVSNKITPGNITVGNI